MVDKLIPVACFLIFFIARKAPELSVILGIFGKMICLMKKSVCTLKMLDHF